jgi:glycosyltransferase involved in cell wall biosynthesis
MDPTEPDRVLAHMPEYADDPEIAPIRLSIIVPAYNEEATIIPAVNRLLTTRFPCDTEVVVVNDGSSDQTRQLLEEIDDPRLRVIDHVRNLGKGAAVLTGASASTGTFALVFDADLEYAPSDIPRLLEPILSGRCQHVYGTRLFGNNTVYQSFWFALGNRVTTFAANVLFDSCITDLHTCLKLVPIGELRRMELRETGFGLDTELTANLLKKGVRPFEVPVTYHGRSRAAGKKITWRDGFQCLRVLARVRTRRQLDGRAGLDGLVSAAGAPSAELSLPRQARSTSEDIASAGPVGHA